MHHVRIVSADLVVRTLQLLLTLAAAGLDGALLILAAAHPSPDTVLLCRSALSWALLAYAAVCALAVYVGLRTGARWRPSCLVAVLVADLVMAATDLGLLTLLAADPASSSSSSSSSASAGWWLGRCAADTRRPAARRLCILHQTLYWLSCCLLYAISTFSVSFELLIVRFSFMASITLTALQIQAARQRGNHNLCIGEWAVPSGGDPPCPSALQHLIPARSASGPVERSRTAGASKPLPANPDAPDAPDAPETNTHSPQQPQQPRGPRSPQPLLADAAAAAMVIDGPHFHPSHHRLLHHHHSASTLPPYSPKVDPDRTHYQPATVPRPTRLRQYWRAMTRSIG